MKQYLLSTTTGKPNHSTWFLRESTDYLRSNRVFDDHAEAQAAMRKSIADYFSFFQKSRKNKEEHIFDQNGLPHFEWQPFEADHMDYSGVQQLVSRLLFDPEYVPSPKAVPLVSTCVDDYDDFSDFAVHCDRKMILISSEMPGYSIKFNLHDASLKENGCRYFSFRIGDEPYEEQFEVFSAILCPLSDEGIPDKRFPGKRYIEKTQEKVADQFSYDADE